MIPRALRALITTLFALAAIFLVIGFVTLVVGCTQVIVEPDRMQINAFLMSTGFETLYHEPNAIFEVNKYRTIPSDVELVFDPITRTVKVKTKANETE